MDKSLIKLNFVIFICLLSFHLYASELPLLPDDWNTGDQFGRYVDISGDLAIAGASMDDNDNGTDAGAAYIFKYDGQSWTEQAKLTAGDGAAGDGFGTSVAINGSYAIIGAPLKDQSSLTDAGAAYIFYFDGSAWTEQTRLSAGDKSAQDNFGISVDIYDNQAIVGADQHNMFSGDAYIFQRSVDVWNETTKIVPSDSQIGARFGHSVAIHGETALVGAYLQPSGFEDYPGAVYVYTKNGGTWPETQILRSWIEEGEQSSINAYFGYSLSLSGNYAIISSFGHDSNGPYSNTGAAYIFYFDGIQWTGQDKLKAENPVSGDEFGRSVSINGDYALMGVPYRDAPGNNCGAVFAFLRDETTWNQVDMQTAGDIDSLGYFGHSVSVGEYYSIVGAGYDFYLNSSPHEKTYIYHNETDLNLHPQPSFIYNRYNGNLISFALQQNYPNPFNPNTIINYELPITNFVELIVYNVLGEKVHTLVNRIQEAGKYSVTFNATGIATGVYVYKIQTGEFTAIRKMILVK